MIKHSLIDNIIKLCVRTWLKSITTRIQIKTLDIVTDTKFKRKIKDLFLEARDLIYQDLYVSKITIKIYNCTFRFKHRNHPIYSEDLIVNCFLIINNRNLEKIFFASKWKSLRLKMQEVFVENNNISNLIIDNGLINLNYKKNNIDKVLPISLNLEGNLIFLENIYNDNKRMVLPLDRNIKFKSCKIENKLININLLSKVIFDN